MRRAGTWQVAGIALTLGVLLLAPARTRAQEGAPIGLFLEGAATLSLHKDTVGVQGTDPEDRGYFDLGVSARLGASLWGTVLGVSGERAAMIDTQGASYLSVFAGHGFELSDGKRLELTGELGWHGFENVGATGVEDVKSENHVFVPFAGGRLTVVLPRESSSWKPGFFVQVRHDLGQGQVTAVRTMDCPSGGADAPVCESGETSTDHFQVGGFSFEAGLELRGLF